MNTETLALQTQIETLLDRNKRLTYALDCLVYVVGLTAIKHESQIPPLQEALNIALETLKYKPIDSASLANKHEAVITTCEWEGEYHDGYIEVYNGKCGIAWSFTEGGITDNGCKFCPKCGGQIVDITKPELEDEECE